MQKCNFLNKIIIIVFTLFITYTSYALNEEIGIYVNDMINSFFNITSNKETSEDQKVKDARGVLQKNLDFEWMAKFVLGRYRKNISDEDFKAFLECYRNYLVNSYADAMRRYKGEAVSIKAVRMIEDNQYVVQTSISKNDKSIISIDYLVRYTAGDNSDKGCVYKVFDVVTEGISLITSQQSEFGSIIGAGDIKALNENLNSKMKD